MGTDDKEDRTEVDMTRPDRMAMGADMTDPRAEIPDRTDDGSPPSPRRVGKSLVILLIVIVVIAAIAVLIVLLAGGDSSSNGAPVAAVVGMVATAALPG
jgi:hypothetical protein